MKKSNFLVGILFLASMMTAFAQQPFYKYMETEMNPDSLLRLYTEGNGFSDETIILFIHDATPGFDPEYDAYKLAGSPDAPQFYSIIDCCNLAVNVLPTITNDLMVQMGYEVGADTDYFIQATEMSFPPDVSIFLEDTQENIWFDLTSGSPYNFTFAPGDDAERFRVWFNKSSELELNVFLEGPYESGDMNTDLLDNALLPLQQPYNVAPWNYSGSESVTAIPANVVDWVLIDIRDASDAASAGSGTSVEMMAAFLLNDGSIVDLDGTSDLLLSQTISNGLFPVIIHRNHLDIIADNAATQNGFIFSYNFTNGSAYGTDPMKNLGGGVYGLYSGDANADGEVNLDDESGSWESFAGKAGYYPGDFNLDGQVDNVGKNDYFVENLDEVSQVPN